MKKIIISYILLLLSILFVGLNLEKVNAVSNSSFYAGEYISGNYIKKVKDGSGRYETARFLRRFDGQFAYCLQPFVEFSEGTLMTAYESDYEAITNMTSNQWERVSLLAYYGYQYGNHNDAKWYIITQMMIWQTADPSSDIYFTSTLDGNRVSLYQNEINEIEQLISSHYVVPSFNGGSYTLSMGQTMTLNDVNGVLSNFSITSSPNLTSIINGNSLIITANNLGQTTLDLAKIDTKYSIPPIVYIDQASQNLLTVGYYNPIKMSINLNVVGGKIKITKVDSDNNSIISQGEATLVGAIYNIYDSNNNVVASLTIGEDKTAITDYLPYGSYTIREVSNSTGYYLDGTSYIVNISSTNTVNIIVKENVIKGRIKIIKLDSETNACQPLGEATLVGAKYGIYNFKNELVDTVMIGNDCTAISKELPYGKYKIKEIEPSTGYYIDSTIYNVNITNSTTINITSKENVIKSRIKVIKLDSETNACQSLGEATLVGAKYGIYNFKNELVDTVIIGNDCTAISKELPYGKYKIKEIEPSTGYYIDSTIYNVNITNSTTINITSKENIIKGRIKITKKDMDTNSTIPQGEATLIGAKYGVYDIHDNLVDTLTIGDDNTATTILLPYGHYKIKELENSIGYYLNTEVYSEFITSKEIYPIIVTEEVIKNTFKFYKFYGNFNTGFIYAEPNAIFNVLNNKSEIVTTIKTDKNGYAQTTLPYGSYLLYQIKGLDNYKLLFPFSIQVKEDTSLNQNIYLKNGSITARLKVIKIDSETKLPIENAHAKFKIKNKATNEYICQTINKVICEFETDDNGILITPLPLFGGDYILEEIKAPYNYLLSNETIEFSIKENIKIIEDDIYGSLIELYFENAPVKGKVEVYKTGEQVIIENNSYKYKNIPLENVLFGIYNENNELITTFSTDNKGYGYVDNLKLGKYILKELKSSNNNMTSDKEYYFELKYKNQNTAIITKKFNLKNYLPKSTLEFTKMDLLTKEIIPNTKIQIYTENDELVFEGITDKNGKIVVDDLFTGKFYIIETESSLGYKLSHEKIFFEVIKNGDILKVNMTNEKIKGILEFNKTDMATGKSLPNTLIEIYNANTNELVYIGKTNEEGKIIVENLDYGKYYILEKQAPDGYFINNERIYFSITKDGMIVKATMKDEKIVEEPIVHDEKIVVPDTYIRNSTIYIISLFFIFNGLGYIIYASKKIK